MAQEESHMEFFSQVSSFLSGEMPPEEMHAFQEDLNKDPEKQALLEEYRSIWDSASRS